jgi:hypothetical protein
MAERAERDVLLAVCGISKSSASRPGFKVICKSRILCSQHLFSIVCTNQGVCAWTQICIASIVGPPRRPEKRQSVRFHRHFLLLLLWPLWMALWEIQGRDKPGHAGDVHGPAIIQILRWPRKLTSEKGVGVSSSRLANCC